MKIYKITEASEYLGVSINTLKTLANNGKIKSFKTNGEHRRFRQEDLDAYMGVEKEKQEKLTVIYARCSTAKQKENLERQKDRLRKPEDLYTGKMQKVPTLILEGDALHRKKLPIPNQRTCQCPSTHINCMTAKDWLKSQLGVWQFFYEGRDIRDKNLHPATFPIALSKKVIELFTHEGELVLDPFVGSGTTLVAASDLNRNAVGFDLQKHYLDLCVGRLSQNCNMFNHAIQIAIQDDARHVSDYFANDSISLIWTSPPYANLLNRKRKNKSRRDRNNDQLGKVEQYSQDDRDLGILELSSYSEAMGEIFQKLLPLLKPKGHCVINVGNMWWENKRITIHIALVEELRKRGYELRNIIIWDRTNIVNQTGIFGWPSNYITMGVTFEYLLDFWRPPNND